MEPTSGSRGAAYFAQVSSELMMTERDETPTFQRIVDRAVEVVDACDHCGISMRQRRRQVHTVASSSPLAAHCDELQYGLEEGPCLEAIWDDDSYLVQDTRTDRRWPRWGPRVADEGIGSVLSIRMATSTETLGALNLYASRPHAYDEESVDVALIYAAHATNAMSTAQMVTGLQTALQSRHLIGVAQGILVHRYDVSLEHAFDVLRRYSSNANLKLRDLAAIVVERRDLPPLDELGGTPERSGEDPTVAG